MGGVAQVEEGGRKSGRGGAMLEPGAGGRGGGGEWVGEGGETTRWARLGWLCGAIIVNTMTLTSLLVLWPLYVREHYGWG
jgi:hypothetical protein